jgi:hypothetical protein
MEMRGKERARANFVGKRKYGGLGNTGGVVCSGAPTKFVQQNLNEDSVNIRSTLRYLCCSQMILRLHSVGCKTRRPFQPGI